MLVSGCYFIRLETDGNLLQFCKFKYNVLVVYPKTYPSDIICFSDLYDGQIAYFLEFQLYQKLSVPGNITDASYGLKLFPEFFQLITRATSIS